MKYTEWYLADEVGAVGVIISVRLAAERRQGLLATTGSMRCSELVITDLLTTSGVWLVITD